MKKILSAGLSGRCAILVFSRKECGSPECAGQQQKAFQGPMLLVIDKTAHCLREQPGAFCCTVNGFVGSW
jgi:hypothetical protein